MSDQHYTANSNTQGYSFLPPWNRQNMLKLQSPGRSNKRKVDVNQVNAGAGVNFVLTSQV